MNRHLLMNSYDIGGGRKLNNDISAVNDITANNKSKGKTLEMTLTSTFTGDITAPNVYTKTQVNNLLTGKASAAAISTAIAGEADTSTTYTKTV